MGGFHRRRFVQGSVVAVATCGVLDTQAATLSADVLVHVQAGDKNVCGFLANIDGKSYVVTNTSLVSGHDHLEFTTLSGTSLKPLKIELSMSRNIARFLVDAPSALATTSEVTEGQGISIVDYAGGGSAFFMMSGSVGKLYPGRFRPEALYEKKHCGSPVLKGDKVCGIANVIDFYKLSGGAWGSSAMRTVYQLAGDKWFSPRWKQYNASHGKALRQIDEFREDVYTLTKTWVDHPKDKLEIEPGMGLDVQRWIKQHNGMVTQVERARSGGNKQGGDKFAAARKDFHDSCKALVAISSSKAKNLEFVSKDDKITPFLKNEFMWRSRELYKFAAYIRGYEKSMERYNW